MEKVVKYSSMKMKVLLLVILSLSYESSAVDIFPYIKDYHEDYRGKLTTSSHKRIETYSSFKTHQNSRNQGPYITEGKSDRVETKWTFHSDQKPLTENKESGFRKAIAESHSYRSKNGYQDLFPSAKSSFNSHLHKPSITDLHYRGLYSEFHSSSTAFPNTFQQKVQNIYNDIHRSRYHPELTAKQQVKSSYNTIQQKRNKNKYFSSFKTNNQAKYPFRTLRESYDSRRYNTRLTPSLRNHASDKTHHRNFIYRGDKNRENGEMFPTSYNTDQQIFSHPTGHTHTRIYSVSKIQGQNIESSKESSYVQSFGLGFNHINLIDDIKKTVNDVLKEL